MSIILPKIQKRNLPKTLRWPVKYSDLASGLAVRADKDVCLSVYFADHNRDYMAAAAGGIPAYGAADQLNLVTVYHRPDWVGYSLWAEPLPAGALFFEAYVWAVPQAAILGAAVHRESVRLALDQEFRELVRIGRFMERWVVQIQAFPEPARLECHRTTWTGLRKDDAQHRRLLLPVPAR